MIDKFLTIISKSTFTKSNVLSKQRLGLKQTVTSNRNLSC